MFYKTVFPSNDASPKMDLLAEASVKIADSFFPPPFDSIAEVLQHEVNPIDTLTLALDPKAANSVSTSASSSTANSIANSPPSDDSQPEVLLLQGVLRSLQLSLGQATSSIVQLEVPFIVSLFCIIF
jgi:hypothetical protein